VQDASTSAARVSAALPIRYTATQIEPALVGIWRPLLLLPKDVESRLTPTQLDAVIAHELCHWKRRDNLTGALHMLVEALFWFHPLVWWIGSRLVRERERACDEAVVEAGHDRLAYAEAILNVAELQVASPMKCAAGVGGVDLKSRVTDVMRSQAMRKLGTHKKLLLNIGALGVVAVPVAFGWLAASNTARAQQEDFLPIVKIAPEYPADALALRLEGHVIVEFTVDENGGVEDPFVVESSSPLFEAAALEAVSKFKYMPRLVDGNPVAVPGVRNLIRFVLDPESLGNTDDFVLEDEDSSSESFARTE
jgi:TonB family protein